MTVPVLAHAAAAIHAAIHAARRGGLGKEPASSRPGEREKWRTANFVCSPLAILLVFAVAMRGARGRTLQEMERLLPVRSVPALLRLAAYNSSGGFREKEHHTGESQASSEEGMKSLGTQFDLASRMYVDSRFASDAYFRSFQNDLLKECSSGEAQMRQLPVQLIDCNDPGVSAKEINTFVSEATEGRITTLVSAAQITPATRLLLVSAAFFRGAWRTPFRHQETKKATFYALHHGDNTAKRQAPGSEEDRVETETESSDHLGAFADKSQPRLVAQIVDMMHVRLKSPAPFYLNLSAEVTAVGLPYRDTSYVMYLVQPNSPEHLERLMRPTDGKVQTDSFPTLEDVVRSMRESLEEAGGVEAHLSLPRFALKGVDNHLDLIPLFVRLLDIEAPFDQRLADFSGISGDQSLLLSAFIHQAEIEVDEKGTVASAATVAAISFKKLFRPRKKVDILIDKPFVFQIRYHPPVQSVAKDSRPAIGEAIGGESTELGDYVLFTGCITDALAAQS